MTSRQAGVQVGRDRHYFRLPPDMIVSQSVPAGAAPALHPALGCLGGGETGRNVGRKRRGETEMSRGIRAVDRTHAAFS